MKSNNTTVKYMKGREKRHDNLHVPFTVFAHFAVKALSKLSLKPAIKAAILAMLSAMLWTGKAQAAEIPWRLPTYTIVARDMDLRMALDTFAVAQGLSVIMSPSVVGTFSGDFIDVAPNEFLKKIATTHNLIWYYDGAALYVYGAGEIATILIDLKYMKADEVRSMLSELGVEDERFPLKKTSNDELVMVSGPPRYVSLVAEMIAKADALRERRTFNEVETKLFHLKHTWADDVNFRANSPETTLTIKGVARLLEELMSNGTGNAIREGAITNVLSAAETAQISAFKPTVRPENRLNAIIVRDVAPRMPMYEKLIKELDVPQKLVEIDVTVVELKQSDALDWQLSLSGALSKGNTDMSAGQSPSNLFGPDGLTGKGLAGALTHIQSSYQLAASLTALREKNKARSISRAALLTVNNLAAEMTDMQSYHARVVGAEVASLEEVSAGTKLQIKPRIIPSADTNKTDMVWLSMELDDGGFESIVVDAMPMTRSSTLLTQTAVYRDESIMLAGYLRDIEEKAGWGIPYLRDIPFIGWLFGGSSTKTETVQRIFIITPHIIDIDQELLVRTQSTNLRDFTEAEMIEDDADNSDEERKKRDLERKDMRERRKEKNTDALERRKAELKHGKEMRQIDRERQKHFLSDDIREWKEQEKVEKKKLKTERAEIKKAKESNAKPATENVQPATK